MRILGLDPGTKRTGYAVIDGLGAADLVDVGVLFFSAASMREYAADLATARRPGMARLIRSRDLAAWMRMRVIAGDAINLIEEHAPDAVAIEVPDGRAGTGSRRGAKGALTSYGMSAGWLSGVASMIVTRTAGRPHWCPSVVVPVPVRLWTRGGGDKTKRIAAIAAMYPSEQWSKLDKGGDARDAIGIARFAWDVLDGGTKLRG